MGVCLAAVTAEVNMRDPVTALDVSKSTVHNDAVEVERVSGSIGDVCVEDLEHSLF